MEEDMMLTTLDNPYNPFTNYDEWFAYDVEKGYNTCPYLARLTRTSDELSDEDESLAIKEAMDSIVKVNVLGNYIIVTESNFEDRFKDNIKL